MPLNKETKPNQTNQISHEGWYVIKQRNYIKLMTDDTLNRYINDEIVKIITHCRKSIIFHKSYGFSISGAIYMSSPGLIEWCVIFHKEAIWNKKNQEKKFHCVYRSINWNLFTLKVFPLFYDISNFVGYLMP